MTFALGSTSTTRLTGVHPDLVRVVKRAIEISAVDFKVIEGVRTDQQAYINYGKGRTAAELSIKGVPDPGKYAAPSQAKVTWLNNPLGTKHRKQSDGFGHAVDLLPAPYDWKGTAPFYAVDDAMRRAARELGVAIRYGGDWDGDGVRQEKGEGDLVHWELK